MKDIVFLTDTDADVDDMIAADYLHREGVLKCVVLDGKSRNSAREREIKSMGMVIEETIPKGTKIVFNGGALTKVAKYLADPENTLDLMVMNGGFAGSNIVETKHQLSKFKGQEKVRTFNFNMDVDSAIEVLASNKIKEIVLVSKNVCHSNSNTEEGLHSKLKWLSNYNLRPGKKLHDLLMAREGLALLANKPTICHYESVKPVCNVNERDKTMTTWGSELSDNSHIKISTKYKG